MVAITGACVAWALVTRAGTAVGIFDDAAAFAGAFAAAAGAFAAAAGAFAAAAGAFAAGAFAAGATVSVSDEPHATAITNKNAVNIGSRVLGLSNLYLDM